MRHQLELTEIATQFVKAKRPLILCGAGVSTDSNIPDYRGEKGAYIVNTKFKPITLSYFMEKEAHRKRYWTRSYLGWDTIKNAKPNDSHYNITRLEYLGGSIITQNVDGLHHKAGSSPLELHGSLHIVQCQSCLDTTPRDAFQEKLTSLNPTIASLNWHNQVNPDGDAQIELSNYDFITLPSCTKCNGILKPKVVFFGENIDIMTRTVADRLLEQSDYLLVIGSTLTTYSAYRFLYHLNKRNHFTASINLGHSRGQSLFNTVVNDQMKDCLPMLLDTITTLKNK